MPITSRAVGVVMFTTPLKALAPYSAEPGAAHHLHLAQVLERLGHAVPLLRAEERDREVPAVLQHQHAAVERRVEAPGVDVEIVDAALHDVHAGHRLQCHRRLTGDRDALEHFGRHDRDGRRRLHDPLGRAGRAFDHDLAERDGHRLEARVGGYGAPRLDGHVHLGRTVAEPAEDDPLWPGRDPPQRVLAVRSGDGALAGVLDRDRDAAQGGAFDGAGHRAGDGAGLLGKGDRCEGNEQEERAGKRTKTTERGKRISAHT